LRVLFVSFIVLIIDQTSKLLVKGFSIPFLHIQHLGLQYGQKNPLLGNLLNITFVENPGIAFGISFGEEFKLLITIFTIVTTIALIYYLYRSRKKNLGTRIAIALIIGGALGNLVDRVFYGFMYGYAPILYGKVVDFLELRIFNLLVLNGKVGNYIFNLADVAVTFGVFALIFFYAKQRRDYKKTEVNLVDEVVTDNQE
jgi:signal peptidase II